MKKRSAPRRDTLVFLAGCAGVLAAGMALVGAAGLSPPGRQVDSRAALPVYSALGAESADVQFWPWQLWEEASDTENGIYPWLEASGELAAPWLDLFGWGMGQGENASSGQVYMALPEDGDCLYTTANVWPAAQSTGWGILSAARAADGIVLRAGNGGLAGACPVTARGGAVLGYAVFRMDDANFDAFFAPLLRGADDLLLVDATWRLLYASQPLRADDTLALLRAQLLSGKSLSDGDGERSYYVGACAESGFSLILQQPQTYTAQVVRSIYLVAALMGALCLVLCLVCAWWLSRRLFEPVNELDGAMRRVEGGDYDVRIESTRQDEMGRLAASFDRMTAEYRQNLERSVQRERELNETRLRMLQSQLNPHFLYNTLDCMKWLGVTGGVPQVAELAADLAALLRAGISGSEYITLEEELELIGRYLAIQEVRFGDRFVCELDVDERFQHCVVPKLILQPLVENAIIHGVADSDEGFIKLWAEEDAEGYLLLKVSDNGSGIPPEVLERLNSHELIPGGHLGLNNVDRIVRLSYGESCGLSAYPNEGGGSCVQLRLPMQKGEDHAQGTDR